METSPAFDLKSLLSGANSHRVLRALADCGCSDLYGRLIDMCSDQDIVGGHLPQGAVALMWERYAVSACVHLREELILLYAPLVSLIAHKVGSKLPSSVEVADLVSYGTFGLIDAIDKFDPSLDIKFETYASTRIRGAILDQLRAFDWIPRSVRAKARAYDRAYLEIEAEKHRVPTNEELASRLEISDKELRQIQWQLSSTNLVALDEVVGTGERLELISAIESVQRATTIDPALAFDQQEGREILGRIIDLLNEREKIVISLYYFKGSTLAEIGRALGVSESRVSQMHSSILVRLRTSLAVAEGRDV